MNYKTYEMIEKMKKLGEKLWDMMWYIPRIVYAKSPTFRKYIARSERKSYEKYRRKEAAKRIFKEFEDKKELLVFDGTMIFDDWFSDYVKMYHVEEVIFDEKWLSKNKMELKEITKEVFFDKYIYNEKDEKWRIEDKKRLVGYLNEIYILTKTID